MPEALIKSPLLPLSSFGRSENIYYHSKYALTTQNLSLEKLQNLLLKHQSDVVFPSHLFDRLDTEEVLSCILTHSIRPRILIAVGNEYNQLAIKVNAAHERGFQFDFIIDRPLDSSILNSFTNKYKNSRWVISPVHFFDTFDILKCLKTVVLSEQIFITFFEPAPWSRLLCNADEIYLLLQQLKDQQISPHILVYENILQTNRNTFFSNPTEKNYLLNFSNILPNPKIRKSLLIWTNLKLSVLAFWRLVSRQNLSLLSSLWSSLRSWSIPSKVLSIRLRLKPQKLAYHPGRKFFDITQKTRSHARKFYYRIEDFLRIFYYQFLRKIYYFFKFTFVPTLFFLMRYRLYHPVRHFIVMTLIRLRHRVLPVIFWPLFKVYWFSRYQYETRIKNKLPQERKK